MWYSLDHNQKNSLAIKINDTIIKNKENVSKTQSGADTSL